MRCIEISLVEFIKAMRKGLTLTWDVLKYNRYTNNVLHWVD